MNEAAFLGGLAALGFHMLLIFARLGSALMLLPGLGEVEVPTNIRLLLALLIALLVLPLLQPGLPVVPETPAALLRLLAGEIAIGLWLGTMARLVSIALAQAGQFLALFIGLVSPLQGDALFAGQGTAPSRLFGLLAVIVLLGTGLYAIPLRAVVASYTVLPAAGPLPLGAGAEAIAEAVAASFNLGLRIAAPLLVGAVVGNVALGLLARIAPQVQVFNIAAPGQILLGLALLAALAAPLLAVWLQAAEARFLSLPGLR